MKQLELDFYAGTPRYEPGPPGTWEHKSGDCEKHGDNVCFFRPYKSRGLHYCVQCALEVLK